MPIHPLKRPTTTNRRNQSRWFGWIKVCPGTESKNHSEEGPAAGPGRGQESPEKTGGYKQGQSHKGTAPAQVKEITGRSVNAAGVPTQNEEKGKKKRFRKLVSNKKSIDLKKWGRGGAGHHFRKKRRGISGSLPVDSEGQGTAWAFREGRQTPP